MPSHGIQQVYNVVYRSEIVNYETSIVNMWKDHLFRNLWMATQNFVMWYPTECDPRGYMYAKTCFVGKENLLIMCREMVYTIWGFSGIAYGFLNDYIWLTAF